MILEAWDYGVSNPELDLLWMIVSSRSAAEHLLLLRRDAGAITYWLEPPLIGLGARAHGEGVEGR